MLSDLPYRLRALFRRSAVEGELDEELRFHFEQEVAKHLRAGLTRAETVRRARLAFGGMEQVKEECREARGLTALETLLQDVRYALRMWRSHPSFALTAVLTIGLGIGVNAAVFTLANAVLFKPLALGRVNPSGGSGLPEQHRAMQMNAAGGPRPGGRGEILPRGGRTPAYRTGVHRIRRLHRIARRHCESQPRGRALAGREPSRQTPAPGRGRSGAAWLTVVGVVPDIWQNDMIRRQFEPLIYLPLRQRPLPTMSIVARTLVPPATLGHAFRQQVHVLDEDMPVFSLRTLKEDIALHDWGLRVFGAMLAIFTAIAVLLASVGLYAVEACSVNQRTQEFGVRLAMGATSGSIVRSVFGRGMRHVALGLAVGLAAAFGLTRVLRAVLAATFQPDPVTFLTVVAVRLAAGMLACTIPARRATRVDAVVALRFE